MRTHTAILSFLSMLVSILLIFGLKKQHSSPRERKWGSASLLAHRNAQVEGALRKRGSTGKNLRSQSFEFLRRESKEKTDERSGEGNELSLSLSCNALYPMRGEPLHSHAMSYFKCTAAATLSRLIYICIYTENII